MRPGLATVLLAAVLGAGGPADAATCRNYGQEIQNAIKRHVEALRLIEREAADRIVGLDTRPYEFLLKEARSKAELIADKFGLAQEEALERCRNHVPPVRHVCAGAAQSLVLLIEEQAAGATSAASKKAYSDAMPRCERWMGLAPLKTAFRSLD